MRFDYTKEVVDVAVLAELKVLAKAVMSCAVDAELLGLDEVGFNLNQAFDTIVRRVVFLREREAEREGKGEVGGSGEVLSGS